LNTTADVANLLLEGADLVKEFDDVQAQSKWSGKALFGGINKAVNFGDAMVSENFGAGTIAGNITAAKLKAGTDSTAIAADLASVDALMLDIADQYMIASNKMSQISSLSAGYALDISSKLDVDFAGETTELAKGQILAQAGTAMLAQANAQGQGMLALIQS